MIDTFMNSFWCLIIDFVKIDYPLSSMASDWVKNFPPDFWNNPESMATEKNLKSQKLDYNLRLLDLTYFDDRHLYELILMSNYWFCQDRPSSVLYGLGLSEKLSPDFWNNPESMATEKYLKSQIFRL